MSTVRAMTRSCMDLFDGGPILEPIECSSTQKIYPRNPLNEAFLEFQFELERNLMFYCFCSVIHQILQTKKSSMYILRVSGLLCLQYIFLFDFRVNFIKEEADCWICFH